MQKFLQISLAVISSLSLTTSAMAQQNDAQALIDATSNTAKRIRGAAYLDVKGCGLDVSTVAGVADRKTGAAAPLHAPLRIGSIGKLYTAATIHSLAVRGSVDLDLPVSRFLHSDDAVGVAGRDATLRQLLNHTAGVPDYYSLPDIRQWDWRIPLLPVRILTAIAGRPATSAPGGPYSYSNSGYQLAALATERATGKPFATLVNEEVIVPLSLSQTVYHETAPGGMLHGYVGRKDYWDSAENTGPDSGITATLPDLRLFMRSLFLDAGPLSAAGAAMIASPVETGKPRQRAGAGAEVRESRDGLMLVGHTGDVEGYLSFAYAAPAHHLTMVGHITASDPAALTELLRTTGSIVARACGVRAEAAQ